MFQGQQSVIEDNNFSGQPIICKMADNVEKYGNSYIRIVTKQSINCVMWLESIMSPVEKS